MVNIPYHNEVTRSLRIKKKLDGTFRNLHCHLLAQYYIAISTFENLGAKKKATRMGWDGSRLD
jgi:hypothetical protein